VYGDSPKLPKSENDSGKPLSPYAATKWMNEIYADVFARTYGMELVGLRYFNIFGPRQSPKGPYAAVIPLFIDRLKQGLPCEINGDGTITRDFTYVANAVQANLKAALVQEAEALNQVYNVACGEQLSLNQLVNILSKVLEVSIPSTYRAERPGDIKASLADIGKAQKLLGYKPMVGVAAGLERLVKG
jgi:UDP-N-acetylglucosamine 4-epimerase